MIFSNLIERTEYYILQGSKAMPKGPTLHRWHNSHYMIEEGNSSALKTVLSIQYSLAECIEAK